RPGARPPMSGERSASPDASGARAGSGLAEPQGRLVLRKHEDRRVRAGHPWIFSNEIEHLEGSPADGDLVEIVDARGAFLGRGYYNHTSLIAARVLTRGRDPIDA